MVGAEVRHKGDQLFIYKIISFFEIMVAKRGEKMVVAFQTFLRLTPESSGGY